MSAWIILLAAMPLLAATVYVHYRVRVHAESTLSAWLLRALLAAVGLAFGYLGVLWTLNAGAAAQCAAFLFGFGVAHVPAFFVLYIKRQRGEYGSG